MDSITCRVPFPLADDDIAIHEIELPPHHFLFQDQPIDDPHNIRPDTSTLASADFDVDVRTGLLPPQPPISRLFGPYDVWESMWDASRHIQLVGRGHSSLAIAWTKAVQAMPIVDIFDLDTIPLLRRAHVVLAFLLHRYVHCLALDVPPQVPESLAKPLLAVSERLDVPPVLIYADTVSWNWTLRDSKRGYQADNIVMVMTFTNTPSEHAFLHLSLQIELLSAPILRLMSSSLDEAFCADQLASRRITTNLYSLEPLIDNLTRISSSFSPDCDPTVFYHDIRPWLNAGLRKFVGVEADKTFIDLGGPSAGQSTLVHALDIFLSIDHDPEPGQVDFNQTFMTRMKAYMPSLHRRFLNHLIAHEPTIRFLALEDLQRGDVGLIEAYNACVVAMRRLRDGHMKTVHSHIIAPAKRVKGELRGTGGTELVGFLKMTRQTTNLSRVEFQ